MNDPLDHADVRHALQDLADSDAVARLHARDASLFSSDGGVADTIGNRLGWLDVARPPEGWPARIHEFADEVARAGVDRVVLAGMGGSSLAPEVFASVLGAGLGVLPGAGRGVLPGAGFQFVLLDSTHPSAVRAALDDADLSTTIVIVASKSGATEETACFAAHAAAMTDPSRLVAITDPGSPLEQQARSEGWLSVFTNPPDIGGRFSALSLFGMLPARLAGADIDAVWASAGEMADRCAAPAGGPDAVRSDPAAALGAFMAGHARAGRDKLTLLAPPELAPVGDWVEQLVAESTGKQGRGLVPVVGEPVASPERYGDDRVFVALRLGDEPAPGEQALAASVHPVLATTLRQRHDLGGLFLQWELATAYAGVLLGVNPFDEPNVAESKANTRAVLDEVAATGSLPEPRQDDVAQLLAAVRPGDYLSLQAYLPPTRQGTAALAHIRATVRDSLGVATTAGWGPRFLHSTGQLHKGGPDTVVALQVVDTTVGPGDGPGIAGRTYDFATLVHAQAVGDLRSLRAHHRRVARAGVGEGGLDEVVRAVEQALQG